MATEYYNFDEPVHQPYNLKADWACFYDGALMTLTQLSGSGSVRVYNHWAGTVIFQTEEQTQEVEKGGYVDYEMTEQTTGMVIAIGAEDESVFQNWYVGPYKDPETGEIPTVGTAKNFVEALDNNTDVRLEFTLKKAFSTFLQENGTQAGDDFFRLFFAGPVISKITAIAGTNLFDTSTIQKVGKRFFSRCFYENPNITSLPDGTFDTSNIVMNTEGGKDSTYFFDGFNMYGGLQSLPDGSFRLNNITYTQDDFFNQFNYAGALTSLPAGSFDTSKIVENNGSFFQWFNGHGALTALPSGSFNVSNLKYSYQYNGTLFWGFNEEGALTLLPTGSFALTNYLGIKKNYESDEGAGENDYIGGLPLYSFTSFNQKGKLQKLPAGSFIFNNITAIYTNCFSNFCAESDLVGLPSGSFRFLNVKKLRGYCFNAFCQGNMNMTALPSQSFRFTGVTSYDNAQLFYRFAQNSALTGIPSQSFTLPTTSTSYTSSTHPWLYFYDYAFYNDYIKITTSGTAIWWPSEAKYGTSDVVKGMSYVTAGNYIYLPTATANYSDSTP